MINSNYIGKRVVLKEKIEAPVILVKKENNNLKFFKKHNKEISYLDKVLTKLYDYPIYFCIQNKDKFKENLLYKFSYLYDNSPVNITYTTIEKMILDEVKDSNFSYIIDNSFFNQNVVFDGIWNNTIIKDYLDIFKLNINYKSNLGNASCNSLNLFVIENNIIVKKDRLFLNRDIEIRYTKDTNSIIIKDILDFVNELDIASIFYLKTESYYKNYINLIYELYLKFIKQYPNTKLEIPIFMQNEIFNLNTRFLADKKIDNENLFKLFLNLFRKEKKFNNCLFDAEDFKKYENVIYRINDSIKKTDEFLSFNAFIEKYNS